MYDFHLHSNYSTDSPSPMEEMVLSAIEKNIRIISITDHIDLYTDSQRDLDFDKSTYFNDIRLLKYKYQHKIEIMTGIELGLQPSVIDRYKDFMKDAPFDFVIMSVHAIDDMDLHEDKYYQRMDGLKALEKYYKAIYSSIEGFKDFDILGHLDYIDRYIISHFEMPEFDEYFSIVKDILKLIIENGKGIEINTSGLRYGLGRCHPKLEILKLYKELGGEIITFGSDAHYPEHVAYGYETAIDILRELSYEYIHIYRNRKAYAIRI